jgi:hypothetical protein
MASKKKDLPAGVPEEGPGGGQAGEMTPAPFGTPQPAGRGALPRVVSQLARAGKGETRYKLHCRNHEGCEPAYVLAAAGDQAAAEACYLEHTGLAARLARLKAAKVGHDEPVLVVRELDD